MSNTAFTLPIIPWTVVTSDTQMQPNNGYIVNAGNINLTLPITTKVGDILEVVGFTGSWHILQNASQYITFGSKVTSVGAGGSLSSTNAGDCVEMVCAVANTAFCEKNCQGNITIV